MFEIRAGSTQSLCYPTTALYRYLYTGKDMMPITQHSLSPD